MPTGMPTDLLEEIVAEVPTIPRFLTAKEVEVETLAIAQDCGGAVRVRRIGQTVQGDPLMALEVGGGERNVLLIGAPHPNEPVGVMTALILAASLGTREEKVSKLGLNFIIVPMIDRDGYALNERWLTSTSFSFARFARSYYRPPSSRQVEWTFPYYSAPYDFSATRPETVALQELIDRARPDLVFSLHNSNVGGVFYYVNRLDDGLRDALLDEPRRRGLPLDPVRPDEPWGRTLAPFILERLRTADAVEYVMAQGGDPRRVLRVGAGSLEYAESVNPQVLGLMAEVPLFADPRCGDTHEAGIDRVVLHRTTHEMREKIENLMRSSYSAIERESGLHPGPFQEAMESALHFQSSRRELLRHRKPSDGATTVAEVFHERVLARFMDLRLLGTLYRFLWEQGTPGSFATEGLLRTADEQIETVARQLEKELQGKRVPIQELVRVQMCAGLHAVASIGPPTPSPPPPAPAAPS